MVEPKQVVIVLTAGKSDNGKNATLAFSCGLSALAMGRETTVFLTSDGAVWGYDGSADGIVVQGFAPLKELIEQFIAADGKVLICSVCHRTCSTGGPDSGTNARKLPQASMAGFASMLELAMQGTCITF